MHAHTAPAAIIADALADAAECYRAAAPARAAEHVARADWAMARHDVTAELRGQAQAAQATAARDAARAADMLDTAAATIRRVYA